MDEAKGNERVDWKGLESDKLSEPSLPIQDDYSVGKNSKYITYVWRGYTSAYQTLDVGINDLFKQYVSQEYDEFMLTKNPKDEVTHQGIAQWVSKR